MEEFLNQSTFGEVTRKKAGCLTHSYTPAERRVDWFWLAN